MIHLGLHWRHYKYLFVQWSLAHQQEHLQELKASSKLTPACTQKEKDLLVLSIAWEVGPRQKEPPDTANLWSLRHPFKKEAKSSINAEPQILCAFPCSCPPMCCFAFSLNSYLAPRSCCGFPLFAASQFAASHISGSEV